MVTAPASVPRADGVAPPSRQVLELLGPSTGGIRRHVAALAHLLPEHGWEAVVAGPADVLGGLARQDAVVEVPASIVAMLRRPSRTLGACRTVRRLAARASVIHAHGLKAALVAILARPGRPLVVTVHNLVLDDVAGRAARVLRVVESAVLRRAGRAIAGSDEIAERVSAVVGAGRVVTITPVALDPAPRAGRAEVRARWGVDDDTPVVVAVARLHPQKHLDMLVRCFAALGPDHARARLVIVGEGPDRDALQRQIDDAGLHGRARLVGAGENPADEIAAADVVALTSRWEGVPLVAVEAMQLGRPLVMTAVGTVGTQLRVDGIGGVAVAPDDEEGFTRALRAYLDDPDLARAAGVAGRGVGERYRATHRVAEVAAVYEEVAG